MNILLGILEQIQYIRQIAHTLPTFESRQWIGSDEELYEEYSEEGLDIDDKLAEKDILDEFDKTSLSWREKRLAELEKEAEELLMVEQQIPELSQIDNERI